MKINIEKSTTKEKKEMETICKKINIEEQTRKKINEMDVICKRGSGFIAAVLCFVC